MIIYLNNTCYQKFDAWLCNKAGKYGFLVSYDDSGFIDDLGDIEFVPKKKYPLMIYLSKHDDIGRAYDQDVALIIEEVGNRIKVCPRLLSKKGEKNFVPILKEIMDDWPETKDKIQPILTERSLLPDEGKTIVALSRPEETQLSDIEKLCIRWVGRGYLPGMNMFQFLENKTTQSGMPLSVDHFKRALQKAAEKGLITKVGRRWQKT